MPFEQCTKPLQSTLPCGCLQETRLTSKIIHIYTLHSRTGIPLHAQRDIVLRFYSLGCPEQQNTATLSIAPLCSLTFLTGNSEGHSWGPCNTPSFDTPPVLEALADRAGAGCSVRGRFKSNKNTIVCASSGSYLQAAALIILTARLGGTGGAILRPGIHTAPCARLWIMHEGKAGVTVNCCDVISHQ